MSQYSLPEDIFSHHECQLLHSHSHPSPPQKTGQGNDGLHLSISKRAELSWEGYVTPSPMDILQGASSEAFGSVLFVQTFANITVIDTEEGLVLVDVGSNYYCNEIHREIRNWSKKPIHSIIYTHGHVDHVTGIAIFDEEAEKVGEKPIQVIGHENVAKRFDRYAITNGYNALINQRQFALPKARFNHDFHYPSLTHKDGMKITVGNIPFELFHDKGETDDSTWVYLPVQKAICTGDLFLWVTPNCGNPQKAQRYPLEWARAFLKMATLNPEALYPGHGTPIFGSDRVKQALLESAAFIKIVSEQALGMINEGLALNDILHKMKYPQELLKRPYLRPIYDEPEFIVRNLWRRYAGWYDQNPAHLKPPSDKELADELVSLCGGNVDIVVNRAKELLKEKNYRLACHMIEYAHQHAPQRKDISRERAIIYRERSNQESSSMARGVYNSVARPELGRSARDEDLFDFFHRAVPRNLPYMRGLI
eukprot:TRINITY_DN4183_c0_g1_i1.p1 TRINITY_DN4183_c0_g1~~TRINITY_DN4183_c0_g1_i1.p1  ORF type:complete len:480 (+),score=95.26 TRINITY_DN4183_c0_g1_i1:189-1628(+)